MVERTLRHLIRCSWRPGDHVVWKSENQERAAIVQSVNAADRTATILYADTGIVELASLLELDPHGTSDLAVNPQLAHDGLGVRRGDFVFIHREGSTNGLEKPRVPRIGEVEAWVREVPISPDGQLGGWRKEMSEIGGNIATSRGGAENVEEGQIRRPNRGDGSFSWFGEVAAVRSW
jgi:ubiquitin-conjugating enzyme E2 O